MEKRYQVFVSSTYTDLIEERQKVFHTLMEIGCIPAGMELFSAADEDQFEFIKKIIDDCDYYLLIIGGRYGSLAEDQISFTEKEYDYALENGMKVVVLVHKNPDEIVSGKTDQNSDLKEKLDAFKQKAMTGRMVDFWENAGDLPGRVAINLNKAIRMYPTVGWVRSNHVASQEILEEINDLRKLNSELKTELREMRKSQSSEIEGLVDFDSKHTFTIKYSILEDLEDDFDDDTNMQKFSSEFKMSWKEIFMSMSEQFLQEKPARTVHATFARSIAIKEVDIPDNFYLDSACLVTNQFDDIQNQLMAYGLIEPVAITNSSEPTGIRLKLTNLGKKRRLENLAIKAINN